MTTQEIVNKLWNLCNVLRDDGITYHQYVTELTYILFLKMAEETGMESGIPKDYRWEKLAAEDGEPLKALYVEALAELGKNGSGIIQEIYKDARTNISSPANLNKIITNIDQLDWFSARQDGLGDLYEGLLQKNANEKKSGAGQYFTPRPLINVMVRCLAPQLGERCNDPAAGTFGFMISMHEYLKKQHHDFERLSIEQYDFQTKEALSGCELVPDAHRLALMNAMLHGIEPNIELGDTLSSLGESMKGYDVVMSNPPFGTKRGGEKPTRSDFTIDSSNKQLNFVMHIYKSLKTGGRAAVVLPDNVLFQDGDGTKVRRDLMDKCRLHTILRLPTGIFYAQGVKTNVLFFERSDEEENSTDTIWYYDLRTNMQSFGKRNPLTEAHFKAFEKAYTATDRTAIQDERWKAFSSADIKAKGDNLDLGLIPDDSLVNYEDLPAPMELATKAISEMEAMIEELNAIKKLLV